MRLLILVASTLAVSGCVGGPAPNFYNGRYYLAGDRSCRTMQAVSESRIHCRDKNGNLTGYRDALTDQQLQMWRFQAANQAAQLQQINESSRRFMQQAQQYGAPPAQLGTPQASSSGVTYTQVGQSLIGSNGVTYRRVGNSLIGTDGTTCQIVGQNIICR